MHLSAFLGDQLYCGYGCQFSFPASAAYLYRRHLQQHHGGIFRAGLETAPTSTADNTHQDDRHDSPKESYPDANNNVAIDKGKPDPEGEVVLNLLDDLLPPGCLSPLPDTPPRKPVQKRRVSAKGAISKVRPEAAVGRPGVDAQVDTPAEPIKSTRWDAGPSTVIVDSVPQWPAPVPDNLQVINAKHDGRTANRLIPFTVPAPTFQARGKDPRIEGIILKRH